jgi:hypothetical protein
MATPLLPPDFKEFLKLLNKANVEYLLIGGYAVGYYGYVRATADMDVWLAINLDNAAKAVVVLREFGFDVPGLSPDLFLQPNKVIRMGVPPFRIEVLTSIDGVDFQACYAQRVVDTLDGIEISVISLTDLKANKQASGRGKDLVDLEHLP